MSQRIYPAAVIAVMCLIGTTVHAQPLLTEEDVAAAVRTANLEIRAAAAAARAMAEGPSQVAWRFPMAAVMFMPSLTAGRSAGGGRVVSHAISGSRRLCAVCG